eukprot:70344-Pyramimonas_sp.AAC.1
MADALPARSPPREPLERGPPEAVKEAPLALRFARQGVRDSAARRGVAAFARCDSMPTTDRLAGAGSENQADRFFCGRCASGPTQLA